MNNSTLDSKSINPQLLEQVVETIFSSLNLPHIDRSQVSASTAFMKEGLNLDSIDILELVVQLENKFGFKFQENESYVQHFKNIGTLTQFVDSKKSV